MDSVGQEFWKGSSVLFPLGKAITYVIAVGCFLGAGLRFP